MTLHYHKDIKIDESNYPVYIKINKKAKNIILKTNQQQHIILTLNSIRLLARAEKFLEEKISWITKKIKATKEGSNHHLEHIKNKTSYFFLGENYNAIKSQAIQSAIAFHDKKELHIPYSNSQTAIKKWKRQQCEDIFTKELGQALAIFNSNMKTNHICKLRLRSMKRRLGSMNSQRVITLNYNLIHMPIECIRAVIYHELAHIIHMNHSKDFYKVLHYNYPNYKTSHAKVGEFFEICKCCHEAFEKVND